MPASLRTASFQCTHSMPFSALRFTLVRPSEASLRMMIASADSRSSSRRIVFSALSSAPRASSTEIVPRSLISMSCQRKISKTTWLESSTATPLKRRLTTCGMGQRPAPARRRRGGRCCKKSSFNGVNSCNTGFWIAAGSFPSNPSRRSTMWSNADRFTSANDRRFGRECKMAKTFCRRSCCDYRTLCK
jgi:hypothetical protein